MDVTKNVEAEPVKPMVPPIKTEPVKMEPKVEFKPPVDAPKPLATTPQVKPLVDAKH